MQRLPICAISSEKHIFKWAALLKQTTTTTKFVVPSILQVKGRAVKNTSFRRQKVLSGPEKVLKSHQDKSVPPTNPTPPEKPWHHIQFFSLWSKVNKRKFTLTWMQPEELHTSQKSCFWSDFFSPPDSYWTYAFEISVLIQDLPISVNNRHDGARMAVMRCTRLTVETVENQHRWHDCKTTQISDNSTHGSEQFWT